MCKIRFQFTRVSSNAGRKATIKRTRVSVVHICFRGTQLFLRQKVSAVKKLWVRHGTEAVLVVIFTCVVAWAGVANWTSCAMMNRRFLFLSSQVNYGFYIVSMTTCVSEISAKFSSLIFHVMHVRFLYQSWWFYSRRFINIAAEDERYYEHDANLFFRPTIFVTNTSATPFIALWGRCCFVQRNSVHCSVAFWSATAPHCFSKQLKFVSFINLFFHHF